MADGVCNCEDYDCDGQCCGGNCTCALPPEIWTALVANNTHPTVNEGSDGGS